MDEDLEKQLKTLTLTEEEGGTLKDPSPYLEVNSNIGRSRVEALSFHDQKLIGGFQITEKKEFGNSMALPKMISETAIKNLNGSNIYLGKGFDTAIKISDYQSYHELKQEFFLKWIIQEKYHQAVLEKKYKKPTFICFGGRITDSLISTVINRFGDWKIYAARFKDSIYFWDVKDKEEAVRVSDLQSFYGIYFEQLLTKSNPDESVINEFDKAYAINEITFGSHQLLCLNEIDAESENGDWVELKVYKSCSPKALNGKYLKYWAQNIVPGINTLVIGKHANGKLKNVEITSTDAMAERIHLNTQGCYEFQDRLLKFISSHLPVNDPRVVKTFSWRCGDQRVVTSDVSEADIPKLMLPKWYTDAIEEEFKKPSPLKEVKDSATSAPVAEED